MPTKIEITPEMIEAGVRELVMDSEAVRSDLVWDVVVAVLEAGGYEACEGAYPFGTCMGRAAR